MASNFNSPEGNLEEHFVDEYFLIDQYIGDTLFTWGFGGFGGLGTNDTTSRSTPVTTFAGGTNWKSVGGGAYTTSAIKTDGTLWVWGSSNYGQAGTNDNTDKLTPVTTFAGGTNWKQVSSSSAYTAAIKTDGTLWTWGINSEGQLGINNTTSRSTPVTTFAGGTNWKQVSAGSGHSAAIKTDGTLWVWGWNLTNQLGTNDTTNRSIPVTTFAGGTNWKQVDCGFFHTAAIKTDGTLWTWGDNPYGALGTNDGTNRSTPVTTFAGGTNWKSVAVGGDVYGTTAAIKTDGTLWIWGIGQDGELGNNDSVNFAKYIPVTTFAGGTNWKSVSIGGGSGPSGVTGIVSAIKTDGTLWTWGNNALGGLGTNDTISRSTPVTTFAGGTNWKQVITTYASCVAITSGTDPTFFVS